MGRASVTARRRSDEDADAAPSQKEAFDAHDSATSLALGSTVAFVVGGALTALPLIGFAYGARRIPYTLTGLLQYISPTLQLLCGALILGESFDIRQAIGFGCIWAALAIYAADGWRRAQISARPTDAA